MDPHLGPALQRNPQAGIQSFSPADSKQKHLRLLCLWSARESPSQNTEPSSSSCQLSLAPCSAEQNPKILCSSCVPEGICDQRCEERQSPPCGKQNEVIYAWELQETPNLSVQTSLCSASQHLQNQSGSPQTRVGERQDSSMCCGTGPGRHSSFPPALTSTLYTECELDLASLHEHGLETFLALPCTGLLDQNC